jgi:hypothetical protein
MQKVNWTVLIVVGVIVLAVLLIGSSLLSYFRWGTAPGWSNDGWGMMGPGMMGGGFGSFGWLGMIFMWLIPIALLVLAVLGIAWLVRSLGRSNTPTPIAARRACPNCQRPTQADWRLCPHCGQALTQSNGTTSPTT